MRVGQPVVPHAIKDAVEGVHQLRAATVVERYRELHARVTCGLLHRAFDIGAHRFGQVVRPADDQETDIIPMNDGELLAQVLAQEAHQEVDFRFRAAPVFHRKRVQRKGGDIESGTRLNYGSRRLNAGAMPRNSRKVTPLRPASIAVHDYSDVLREPLGIQIREEAFFLIAGWFDRVRNFHAIDPANSMWRIEDGMRTFRYSVGLEA